DMLDNTYSLQSNINIFVTSHVSIVLMLRKSRRVYPSTSICSHFNWLFLLYQFSGTALVNCLQISSVKTPSLKCSLDWSISLGIHGLVISEYDIRESTPTAPHLFPLFRIRDSSPCVCKTNHKQKKKEKPLFIRLNQ